MLDPVLGSQSFKLLEIVISAKIIDQKLFLGNERVLPITLSLQFKIYLYVSQRKFNAMSRIIQTSLRKV